MKDGVPILMMQVSNGFKVKEPSNSGGSYYEDEQVFQSFAELCGFLEGHFDHRNGEIAVDED